MIRPASCPLQDILAGGGAAERVREKVPKWPAKTESKGKRTAHRFDQRAGGLPTPWRGSPPALLVGSSLIVPSFRFAAQSSAGRG